MLAARVPAPQPIGLAAGLHIALWLPSAGPTEDEVVARAAERSAGLCSLDQF